MSETATKDSDTEERSAFGQLLRQAREQASMSVTEVAAALNLPEDMVEAIERSELDRLPPAAFVQGYIRNYAKHVGIDAKPVLESFALSARTEQKELQPRSHLPAEADSATPAVRIITVLVVVIAAAVVLYAIYSYYSRKSSEMELERTESQPVSEPALEQWPVGTSEPGPRPLVIPPRPADAGPEDALQAVEPVAAPVEVPRPAVEEADEPEPQPATAATGGDSLRLSATGDSWVEIVDASDKRLYYGLISVNRELKLNGRAPFDVFLGNAPVVDVTVNGIKVDMTKYTRSNNIARFRVSTSNGQLKFH